MTSPIPNLAIHFNNLLLDINESKKYLEITIDYKLNCLQLKYLDR